MRELESLPEPLVRALEPLAKQLSETRKSLRGNASIVGEVTVGQIVDGARCPVLICETSAVRPDQGLYIRKRQISELSELTPAGAAWLLLTGELANSEQLEAIEKSVAGLQEDLPDDLAPMLYSCRKQGMHPMMLLCTALQGLSGRSLFSKVNATGASEDRWKAALYDYLCLLAWLPSIVAAIFSLREEVNPDEAAEAFRKSGSSSGMVGQFLTGAGLEDQSGDLSALLNLYLVLLSDHGKGNASANVGTITASTLANPFQAIAAAALALDGPAHGRANLEADYFIRNLVREYGEKPDEASVRGFLEEHLGARQKIPGIGHGVLECEDPRFSLQMALAERRGFSSPMLSYAKLLGQLAPEFLKSKTNRCWPNVDLATGALFDAAGFSHPEFLTVLFAWSRSIGIGAQIVLDRMMELPLIRQRAVTLPALEELANVPLASD